MNKNSTQSGNEEVITLAQKIRQAAAAGGGADIQERTKLMDELEKALSSIEETMSKYGNI